MKALMVFFMVEENRPFDFFWSSGSRCSITFRFVMKPEPAVEITVTDVKGGREEISGRYRIVVIVALCF
ncbi:MAG: hypothetical protein D3910_05425 [Candidatus Electrothrix sp. ATG2]|nr:hypothetical protein [Candidatus Electrothrix sp. ATG2]